MPLTWAQVRGDLDPKKYTIRTVPALLAKTKAWDGYDDAAASIKAAMKKLAGSRVGKAIACPPLLAWQERMVGTAQERLCATLLGSPVAANKT